MCGSVVTAAAQQDLRSRGIPSLIGSPGSLSALSVPGNRWPIVNSADARGPENFIADFAISVMMRQLVTPRPRLAVYPDYRSRSA